MKSTILSTATIYLMPLLLLFSIFLLLRGHNEPGGGFAGGLVASSGFALCTISFGLDTTKRLLRFSPTQLMGFGLLCSVIAGLLPLAWNLPFLTGLWNKTILPGIGKLGTPLLFDVGVYLVVTGMVTTMIFELVED